MDIREFIYTYSDDLMTIHHARAAAHTHPLRGTYGLAAPRLDASFCRILAVFFVSGMEAALQSWHERDRLIVLDKYFARDVTKRRARHKSVPGVCGGRSCDGQAGFEGLPGVKVPLQRNSWAGTGT